MTRGLLWGVLMAAGLLVAGVFGSLMLWFYGFALTGALWKARNA